MRTLIDGTRVEANCCYIETDYYTELCRFRPIERETARCHCTETALNELGATYCLKWSAAPVFFPPSFSSPKSKKIK